MDKENIKQEGSVETSQGNTQQTPQTTTVVEDEVVTLSKRELELRLNSEADKRVSQALKTHEQKLKEQFQETIRLEREEAEKLAKMKADEREQYERQKFEATLKEKERQLTDRELKLKTTEYLSKNNLPLDVMEFVIGNDESETQSKLEKLNVIINKKIEEEKAKWIQSNSDTGIKTSTTAVGKKLSLDEIAKIPDQSTRLKAMAELGL